MLLSRHALKSDFFICQGSGLAHEPNHKVHVLLESFTFRKYMTFQKNNEETFNSSKLLYRHEPIMPIFLPIMLSRNSLHNY